MLLYYTKYNKIMDHILDKFFKIAIIYLALFESSYTSTTYIMFLTLIAYWAYNKYSYLLDEYDYFPDDVTFVDGKKALR